MAWARRLATLMWSAKAARGLTQDAALHSVTPLVRSAPLSALHGREIYFKLDCLQPPGSFKVRGMGRVVQRARAEGAQCVVSSSGGNAGLATAYAAQKVGLECVVVLPRSTPASVRRTLETLYGARVVVHGAAWDEANVEALRIARETSSPLVHPFEDAVAWEGHASAVSEIVQQLGAAPDCIVASVGGGGLLMGMLRGVELHAPTVRRLVAVETRGADSFDRSFKAGAALPLPGGITSIAKSLGAITPSQTVLDAAIRAGTVTTHTVSDADALAACLAFADERRLLVEPACGASLATVYDPGHFRTIFEPEPDIATIVIQVCGGAVVDMPAILAWADQLGVDPSTDSRGSPPPDGSP